MNINIEEIEKYLAEKIQNAVGSKNKIIVEPYPDDPRNYNLLKREAAILISYSGTNYNKPEAMRQEIGMTLVFMVLTRSLRLDTSGAYQLMRIIRKQVTNILPMSYLTNERAVGYDPELGIHRHQVSIFIPGLYYAGEE